MQDTLVAEVIASARRLVAAADADALPRIVRAADMSLDRESRWLRCSGGASRRLTPSAAALAGALMSRPGESLSRAELLRALGWYADPLATRRLDVTACRLRRLLPGSLTAVERYGYCWTPPA